MAIVRIRGLWWKYRMGEGWTLKGVNLELERGAALGIMGPSGAGKTTLCLTMNGLIPQRIRGEFKGEVVVCGRDATRTPVHEMARLVGLVMQDPESQFITMSVEDELAFGMENLGVPREEMRRLVEWALEEFGIAHLRGKHPLELSGGEKQRVAIASVLLMRPEVLVLDEPASNLDPAGRAYVYDLLRRLRERGDLTIILVEHDVDDIVRLVDEIAILVDGRILVKDDKAEIFEREELVRLAGIGMPQAAEIMRELAKEGVISYDELPLTAEEAAELIRPLLPRDAPSIPPAAVAPDPPRTGEPVIMLEDVWYEYPDGTVALRGVSLTIHRGEYVAILGRNGSGKTTLTKIMTGLLKPTRGRAVVCGLDTRRARLADLVRRVGYCMQNPDYQLFCTSVEEELRYGPRNLGLPEDEVERRCRRLMEALGLSRWAKVPPHFLGKGLRLRVVVASILAMDPEIIIVDEPTTGQDWRSCEELMRLLDRLNSEGRTVIVVSHHLRFIAGHARRAIVLDGGRVIFDGDMRSLFRRRDVLERACLRPPSAAELGVQLFGVPALTSRELASWLKSVLGA